LAKRGEKVSEETKRKMSISQTKPKKLCKHCNKMIASLDSHYGNCRKNPENKERFRLERIDYEKPYKEKIKSQKSSVWHKYYPKNSKRLIEKNAKIFQKNKDDIYIKRNIRRNKNYFQTRNSLMGILGGVICKQCKFKDHRALDIEHIYDTGHLDDKRFYDDRQRNSYYIKHPLEAIENLQIFCSNCNQSKKKNKVRILSKTTKAIKAREYYHQKKQSAVKILGGYNCKKCKKCNDPTRLEIDHIQNDGNKDRKKGNQGTVLFNTIIKNPNESKKIYQMLCSNCNKIKKDIAENGKCNCDLFHVSYF
jgi:hypothetical protein